MSTAGEIAGSGLPASNAPVRIQRRHAWLYLEALSRDKLALFAATFLALLLGAAIFAPVVAPFDPAAQSLALRNQPPMTADEAGGRIPHLLGTDQIGRDVLSRLIYGARISLAVAAASVLISGLLGTTLGLLAGYYRTWIDDLIMRMVDVQMGFPSLLLALFVLYALGSSLWNVVFVLAITRWMVYARLTRSLVLSYRENVFVEAARSVGARDRRIIFFHLVPNLLSPILVLATLEAAVMILTESSLSFLGLGLPLSEPSWGQMLAQGRMYVTSAWWLVTFPGLAILFTCLSLNLLAIWVRTVTDPAQRWRYLPRSKREDPPPLEPAV